MRTIMSTTLLRGAIFICFLIFVPFTSKSCHLVSITETSAIDNGDGTYTYTFDICTGIEDSYGFFISFSGANLISFPASVTGPSTGNTINASVPPVSGSGDIEYGDWDSNAGVLYSGVGVDCSSMTFTFDGSLTQVDIGGTQAFFAGGPCSGSTTATTCFASAATYSISITPSNSNNQSYSFGLDGFTLASGFPTNGQTDVFLICGCASTFTVTASGGASVPSWSVTQIGVGVVGSGSSEVVNSPLAPCIVLLPIELIEFSAGREGDQIALNWSTATEINNDYFVIERSEDLDTWEVIDQVDGAGSSNELINYRYFDVTYGAGSNYYRLKQVDFDGAYSYSNVAVVNEKVKGNISVYPDPFVSSFNVSLTLNHSQLVSMSLVDLTGREYSHNVVSLKKGNNDVEMTIPDLASGVYYLKAIVDDEVRLVKVVKK